MAHLSDIRSSPAAGTDDEPAAAAGRAARIYRNLRLAQDPLSRYRWRGWGFAECFFLAGLILCIPLLLIEPALLPRHPVIPPTGHLSGRVAALLLFLLPFHGWALHRILQTTKTRREPTTGWVVACRFLAASLPLLGLFVLPLWRRIETRGSSWAYRRRWAVPSLDLAAGTALLGADAPRSGSRSWLGLLALMITISFVLPLVWTAWLGGSAARSPQLARVAIATAALLHAIVAVCLAGYKTQRALGRRAWRRWALPVLGLAPIVGVAAIFLGFLRVDGRSDGALVNDIYNRRWNAARLPAWLQLENALGNRWRAAPWWQRWRRPFGLERPSRVGRAEKGLRSFYRYKSLLVFFDATAVVWLLLAVASGRTARAAAMVLRSLWFGAIGVAALGITLQTAILAARILRATELGERLARHPYGQALLYPYLALAAGLLCGDLLATGDGKGLLTLVVLLSTLAATCGGLLLIMQPLPAAGRFSRVEPRDLLPFPLIYLAFALVELILALNGGIGRAVAGLKVATALSPLGSLICWMALGRWLLRPFRAVDLASPSQSPRRRLAIAFFLLTGMSPLGGLVIPFYVLSRQRLWPRSADFLATDVSETRP